MRSATGFAAFAAHDIPEAGRALLPMEASWMLGCPLVSAQLGELALELNAFLATGQLAWDMLLISGLPREGRSFRQVAIALAQHGRVFMGPTATRRLAAIEGDLQRYLGRRTAKFRKNLRRTERLVARTGMDFEWWNSALRAEECEQLFARVLAVEARGWKGRTGVGIDEGDMCTFYRQLMTMQGPEGAIRLGFARADERDQGYILGGVCQDIYRGYQFSYASEHESLGLGNWMQLRAIERLCAEGINYYDLGSDMAYKLAWADYALETSTLLVHAER